MENAEGVRELETILEESFEPKTDFTKYDSGSSYDAHSQFTPSYLKGINNANSEQTQKIKYVIERELKWLDSNEYILRKKEATGMSESKIKEDVQKIKEQLKKTEINFLDEKADLAGGIYHPNKKNPLINIFKNDDKYLNLNLVDHELKHAVSELAIETMDDLIKPFTSNYKKYPKINNKRIIDYLIPVVETAGQWASNAPEQQVVSKRIMDTMETNYGKKRGDRLTTDDLEKLKSDLNYQIKRGDQQNHDICTMLFAMKQKHKGAYTLKVCEMVNKAY